VWLNWGEYPFDHLVIEIHTAREIRLAVGMLEHKFQLSLVRVLTLVEPEEKASMKGIVTASADDDPLPFHPVKRPADLGFVDAEDAAEYLVLFHISVGALFAVGKLQEQISEGPHRFWQGLKVPEGPQCFPDRAGKVALAGFPVLLCRLGEILQCE
jgi:hypothetical protein